MKRVSLTPAVFHISDKVTDIAGPYGKNPIVPRGPALKPIMDSVRRKMVVSLNAEETHETVIFTASGSGAIAAAMGSCVDEKGILVISNGAYGERQADFSRQTGNKTWQYQLPYGERPDLDKIESLIKEHQPGAIGMVHGATSSCNVNPVAEVGALAKKYNCRFIVDGIASSFVEELKLQEWGIDVLISSTNKGLHSHPDLAFVLIEKSFAEDLEKISCKTPYLDIRATLLKQRGGGHPFTINPRALLEAEAALDDFQNRGGLKGRIQMYQERTNLLRKGYKALGLQIFEKEGMPFQNIGTALYLPEGITFDDLAELMAKGDPVANESYEIYSAQGKLSSSVFRIFNMGEYSLDTYERFLSALQLNLKKLGFQKD